MSFNTDGPLPTDTQGNVAGSGYAPNVGTVALQVGTVTQDVGGQPYGPLVIAGSGGVAVSSTAANTPPTASNIGMVAAISPNNTGLPVNVPAIVQKTSNASTGSVASLVKAFASNNVAGNSIIVVCGCGNGTAMTVADSKGNTYIQAVNAPNSTTFEAAIFYAVNIAGGANTVTVTNAGSTASMAMQIYEVSGLIAQAGALGQNSSGTGTGTTGSTSALAPGSPNSLIFLGIAVGTTAEAITAVTGTNWTVDSSQNTTTPTGLFSLGALSLALDNHAPVIPQATIAQSKPWAAAAAIFKPVVLGIQGTVSIGGYNYTHITTQTTTLVKTGAGILHAIIINKPLASGVVEFDDALTQTGAIGIITLPGTLLADGPKVATYDLTFNTGLSITTSGATQDITVVWR